jgi:hypothetical protein
MQKTLLISMVLLVGCGERIEKITKLQLEDCKFEYAVIHTEVEMGGPCTGITMPNRFFSYDYFYLPTDNGVIAATDVIMTHDRGKTKSPWIQTHMLGKVECRGDKIVFDLQIPEFDDSDNIPDVYHDYVFNGAYFVE